MALTGEVDWHWKKFCLQIFVSSPLLGGKVNLFNSTGKIENKEKWDPEKKKKREKKKRGEETSNVVFVFLEKGEKAM